MTEIGARCSFCGEAATFAPDSSLHVCEECVRRVAALAANPSETLWASHTTKAADEPAVVVDREQSNALAEFKRGVEKTIGSDNGEAHLNLAQAYAEMGLYEDARREAGTAIRAGAKRSFVESALRILLTEPLLSADGRQRLREFLRQKLN